MPSVPLQNFDHTLQNLNDVSLSSSPCVILGDLNEDILQQANSRIVRFMSSHGYTQLVKSPTATGTLVDHVYCNNSPANITNPRRILQ